MRERVGEQTVESDDSRTSFSILQQRKYFIEITIVTVYRNNRLYV